ncbi:MAG: XdhC family protein [Pseudomonadota bacterium]
MLKPIHYIEHAADVIGCAVQQIAENRQFVLVTAVDMHGGSSRELGTLALVTEDGEMFGYLSNGCIDRDIQLQAENALSSGTRRILHYGAGSPFMDLTLPCGGGLKLLLDPDPDTNALKKAHSLLSKRQEARLEFTPPDGSPMQFIYGPKPRLALAGRGSVFRAMAETGHGAGFDLMLYSPERDDLAAVERFAPVRSEHLTNPQNIPSLELDRHSAFLTLFHDHDWEPDLLLEALKSPARFIGSLGSKRTHKLRCNRLMALGASPDEIARIAGPIGLVPSLRQAPFIAVSAMAHIIERFPRFIEVSESEEIGA